MSQPGRNEACPCGSGKKFKHCCLGKPEEAGTELGRLAHRLNAEEGHVAADIVEWAQRRFGTKWAVDALAEVLDGPAEDDDSQFFMPWLIYHRHLDGATPAARYEAERGPKLSAAERDAIARHTQSWLSLWEVRRTEPGVGIELYDLLSQQTRFVHDVRSSRTLGPWCVVLGYVVDYAEVSVYGGVHPNVIPPRHASLAVETAKRLLRVRTRAVPIEHLKKQETEFSLIQCWETALDFINEERSDPPMLQNTDGDPLLMCTDHFTLSADGREVLRRLESLEGALLEELPGEDPFITFSRPGNRMHAAWPNTVVGKATVRGNRLLVQSNSSERADTLRQRIEAAAAGQLRFKSRSVSDPRAMLLNQDDRPDEFEQPVPAHDPRGLAVMRRFIDSHYESWPDQKLPALGGLTPRDAAKDPAARRDLIALLKDMEFSESQKSEAERYEFGTLWKVLGLEQERGGSAPESRKTPRAPAGRR